MGFNNFPGSWFNPIGPGQALDGGTTISTGASTLDAVNEAAIYMGYIVTEDGASHTIDTSGSSSLQFRLNTATFANAGTTVKVGLAAVDTTNGPPARAANAANVITFDVSKSLTGGGGGLAAGWNSVVPDAGTKTVANGDFIAFAIQMTARGGADAITPSSLTAQGTFNAPACTDFVAAAYTAVTRIPNCLIVFSDGKRGWFFGSEITTLSAFTVTVNAAGALKEYGQLYNFPFPYKVYGIWGWLAFAQDTNVILYSDPLVSPVAERTVTVDANAVQFASGRRFSVLFPTPYEVAANTNIVYAVKPSTSTITAYKRTLNNAADRVAEICGTTGYAVTRNTGAFSDSNSSLDIAYIGPVVGGYASDPVGQFKSFGRGNPY